MHYFDPRELRNAFGSFMTGVTVVTSISKSGEKVGFTANSFTSVSVEPPLLLVCPAKNLSTFDVFNQCEHFVVNILSDDQQGISNIFASAKGDRFTDIKWHSDAWGCPIIDGAVAHFSCMTHNNVAAGDHIVLIGQVTEFSTTQKLGLGYARGGYFSLAMEHRAEELTHTHSGVVGAIIEFENKVLVRKEERGYDFVKVAIKGDGGSKESLHQYLAACQLSCEVGSVYSIYENLSDKTFSSYYRVNAATNQTASLGEYVDIETLKTLEFKSSDLQSMMERFILEKKNGVFRLYVGDQNTGDIH